MSRKRFKDIKKYIHFANNDNLSAGDKLAKIRPLQDRVNTSLPQFEIFAKYLSVDEQMMPYFDRHSAKMFIRGKPIRFGYKNWVLASSDGYPYKFETYTGACKTKDSRMPLGPQVVSDLLSIVEDPACHCVYFDRFFTSYSLLRDLHEKNFKALGTIRKNRTMKCPLRLSKAVDKENRGFLDNRSDDYVSIVQWKDNKVVFMGSNFSNIEPTKKVKLFIQRDKKRIDCVQPFCFYLYNQGMGGVDLLDRFISQYQPSIQAKKWYWPLFLNCIEMLTVAAWRLHVTVQGSPHLDLLDFIWLVTKQQKACCFWS